MSNSDMLNVLTKASFDNSISRFETHTHPPYITNALSPSDEIRIPIQQQDIYVNIHDSLLYIEGKLTPGQVGNPPAHAATELVTNAFAHFFEEIRYELNGQTIDKCRNVGIASTMKGYVTFNQAEAKKFWNYGGELMTSDGYFSASIPLKTILGFPEHYDKILMNAKHELVLLRAKNDHNVFKSTVEPKIDLTRIQWHVNHVNVSDSEKIQLLRIVDSKKNIEIPFRSFDLYECPMLTNTTRQSWTVKTSMQMEKPRYIIIGFQTNRKTLNADSSKFDYCKITNVKLYLNSETYPYDNLNVNFDNNQYEILYHMYANFQKSYLNRDCDPLFDRKQFKESAPLVVIDCSKQVDGVKASQVDVRLEIETSDSFPANTVAYALIIHDRVIEYNPATNVVKILV